MTCAVLTITFNEPDFLKMWYCYYSKHFDDADIYIIDDGTDLELLEGIGGNIEFISDPLVPGERKHVNDARMKKSIVDKFNQLLTHYNYVLKIDTDEFVVPDPEIYPDGLSQFIHDFKGEFAQCSGYNVVDTDDTGVFDSGMDPWLHQRTHWQRDWHHFCKVVLANCDPMWGGGYHDSRWNTQHKIDKQPNEREDLRLIHMHYACAELVRRRYERRRCEASDGRFNPDNAKAMCAGHVLSEDMPIVSIPDKWRNAI